MLKVATRVDEECLDVRTLEVKCPSCKRMMLDVQYVSGVAAFRIKCARCKHYIKINITE